MKRKLTILLLAIILSFPAFAQLEVKPDSFKEVKGFVNINLDIQSDDNDVPYAIVKVKTENINDKQRRELLFQGDAATFIELEYKVGEVWVYLTYKASYLKISHPDLSSTEFWFPFDMEPKKGYELTLVNKTQSDIDEQAIINLIDQRLENTNPATLTESVSIDGYKFLTLNASVNKYGDLAYGFTLGKINKFGWFASVMTNFNFNGFSTDFECDADLLVNGYYPVYTGKEAYTSLSIIGGFMMRITKPLSARIGIGYGNRTISYETLEDKWVKNNNVSVQGVDVQLGLQYDLKGFVISADCVASNFKTFETKIGLGYGF
ncbi:MAG: hypothetical protein IJK92_02180 [Bacteroidales bacterium]|nr:hypothetical protein [Bacteroidales bacterium]